MAIVGNGSTGWVARNLGIEAELSSGYTMMVWMRVPTGVSATGLVWGGGGFIHSALYATTGGDGYFFDDVDNAFFDSTTTVFQTHNSTWVPVIYSKASQSQGTLYVGPGPTTAVRSGTANTAQTLTAVYIGQDETGTVGLTATQSLAEAAIWSGPLGPTEIGMLLAGANPLTVGRLICYFPLRNDLRDYGPRGLSLIGAAPVFTDHPPVQNHLEATQTDGFSVVGLAPVTGALNVTLAPILLSAAGGPVVKGQLNTTLAPLTLVGALNNNTVTGQLNTTLAPLALTGSASVAVNATLNVTLAPLTLTGSGSVTVPLTTLTSVITIDGIAPEPLGDIFGVTGTYTLYPSLQFADDSTGSYTPISNVAPLGAVPFNFVHPGMPVGPHILVVSDPVTTNAGSVSYLVDASGNIVETSPFPPSGPALTSIIPAYLYEQYFDDQDLQAFMSAYNGMAQTYLDWFNSINLPVYTGAPIAGSLLDWVAQGLYGISRPTISFTQVGPAIGPFDTYPLDSIPMNFGEQLGQTTLFVVNDDIFKRCITWSFYKGDGKVFNIRWLKRRLARFLVGVNGTDYTGPTYQISVSFTGTNTVNIVISSGSMPTTYAPVLQAALLSGVLPLPFQYNYTVTLQ